MNPKTVLHVGPGHKQNGARLPPAFDPPEWREIRLDIDPANGAGGIPAGVEAVAARRWTSSTGIVRPWRPGTTTWRTSVVGCTIAASDTQPLREAIKHDATGRLVDFFDVPALANEVCALLDDPAARARLGANAREFARANYDLKTVCLPRQLQWVQGLVQVGQAS